MSSSSCRLLRQVLRSKCLVLVFSLSLLSSTIISSTKGNVNSVKLKSTKLSSRTMSSAAFSAGNMTMAGANSFSISPSSSSSPSSHVDVKRSSPQQQKYTTSNSNNAYNPYYNFAGASGGRSLSVDSKPFGYKSNSVDKAESRGYGGGGGGGGYGGGWGWGWGQPHYYQHHDNNQDLYSLLGGLSFASLLGATIIFLARRNTTGRRKRSLDSIFDDEDDEPTNTLILNSIEEPKFL